MKEGLEGQQIEPFDHNWVCYNYVEHAVDRVGGYVVDGVGLW